jgi:hypothetical protein
MHGPNKARQLWAIRQQSKVETRDHIGTRKRVWLLVKLGLLNRLSISTKARRPLCFDHLPIAPVKSRSTETAKENWLINTNLSDHACFEQRLDRHTAKECPLKLDSVDIYKQSICFQAAVHPIIQRGVSWDQITVKVAYIPWRLHSFPTFGFVRANSVCCLSACGT